MELEAYFRFLAALVFVLALLAVFYIIAKRLNRRGVGVGGGPRLAIVEARAVDQRRRLVLVRRDDREHLILIGGGGDVVIERDIPIAALDAEGPVPVQHADSAAAGLAARIAGLSN